MSEEISRIKFCKFSFIWFYIFLLIFSLVLYGILLKYFYGRYILVSYIFHTWLAMAIIPIIVLEKEKILDALKNIRNYFSLSGMILLIYITLLIVFGIFIRAFILRRNVYFAIPNIDLLILLAIYAPITEELFFRWFLQRFLKTYMKVTQALLLASFLFSIIHIPKFLFAKEYITFSYLPSILNNLPIYLFSLFVMGILYGYIYEETKKIGYPIVCHSLINFILSTVRY